MASENTNNIRLCAQQRRSANNAYGGVIEGIRIRSETLSVATSQAIAHALSLRNGQALLLESGFSAHTIAWLRTLTETERLRACLAVEVLLPAAVFNAQAAIKFPIEGASGSSLDQQLIEHYLITQGAHAGMMSDVCGMSDYDYGKQLKRLGLSSRKGRPACLSHDSVRDRVLDVWSKLQRSELLAAQRAAKQGEGYQSKSKAAMYLALHYEYFANENLAAIYNMLCDVPAPSLELGET